MPFKPGHKKMGGRPKGSINKANRLMREIVETKLGKSIPERLLELAALNPEDEVQILKELLPYCYCKLAPVQIPLPPSPEEEALMRRQYEDLSQHLDHDPNPK